MCNCADIINVKIKLLYEDSILPKKAHKDDACYDVYAHNCYFDSEYQLVVYELGFATEIPKGYVGKIVPRSSFTKTKYVLQNSPATIDGNFRGEWILKFKCIDPEYICGRSVPHWPFTIGDRIAQIYFEKVLPVNLITVDTLEDSDRGSGGFGSTNL